MTAQETRGEPRTRVAEHERGALRLPLADPAKRRYLPLAESARARDQSLRPRVAVWELTLRCNLSCIHCGSRAGKARKDELTTDECLGLVEQLAALDVLEVSLIGGEAHLHAGFLEVLRALKLHGIEVGMTTGGRGIDGALARKIADAGLNSVSVSLDGLEATHDALRGLSGSFASAISALDAFRAAGVFVSVNTQINRANYREVPELLELLISYGARAFQIALTVAMGRAADHPHVLLQPYDLLEVYPIIAGLKRRRDEAGVRMWPGNNIGYFGPYESARGDAARALLFVWGGGDDAWNRSGRHHKGLPVPSDDGLGGWQCPRKRSSGNLGARGSAALRPRSHGG